MEKTVAIELIRVAKQLLVGYYKHNAVAPTTAFEKVFFDIREQAKNFKETQSLKAQTYLQKLVIDDLTQKGWKITSFDLSLGKYRGSRFVTSAKLFVAPSTGVATIDSKPLRELEVYLQQTYSPKFRFKSIENGIAFFNIR